MNLREPYPTPATILVDTLIARHGRERAPAELDALLAQLSTVEVASLAYDWSFWARAKQVPPDGAWRSFGYLTGRGNGKTISLAHHIVGEVQAERAMVIGLAAQNLEKTKSVQVDGLIDASPPWFKPEWIVTSSQLVWPNGAVAWAFTPEVPGAIRSPNFHLCWLSEVQSWPTVTREEALLNFQFATRVGYARTLWDATPKKRHPILRRFLSRSASEPDRHIVYRGRMIENRRNLAAEVIEDLVREYGGTQQGLEELDGEMSDEAEGALFKAAWIRRASSPTSFVYRVISVDPAVTSRKGSDTTGIVGTGLDLEGRAHVLTDDSGRHQVGAWGELVLDRYDQGRCDLVIAETNKGGDLVVQNLRAAAASRGLSVVIVGKEERPRRLHGTVFVREVHARGAKDERAQPVATAYEKGRVVHAVGADLTSLEETMTTWEPTPNADSPGDLDALVHGVVELLGLSGTRVDAAGGFRGILDVASALGGGRPAGMNIADLLGRGSSGGGRI